MSSPARMQQERSVVLVLVSLHAVAVAALIIKFSRSLQSASAAAERRAARRCPGPDVVCVYQPLVRRTSCGDEKRCHEVLRQPAGASSAELDVFLSERAYSAEALLRAGAGADRGDVGSDGVASALARGRGSGGGSESATALTRTCCVSAAPWAHAARVARPAAGSGFVPRPRRRRRARLALRQGASPQTWSRLVANACQRVRGLAQAAGGLFAWPARE